MKAADTFQLSPAQSNKLWHKCLMSLYLPVVASAMTHLLVYPMLMLLLFIWYMRNPVMKAVLQDRAVAKLLFGFVAVSFAFLSAWLYLTFEPARVLVSSAYVVFAVMLGRRLETLAHTVWRGARTSYQV